MGLVIGQGGSNIKRIQQETQTRIKKCCKTGELGRTGFTISGSSGGCEGAKEAINHCVVSMYRLSYERRGGISFIARETISYNMISSLER